MTEVWTKLYCCDEIEVSNLGRARRTERILMDGRRMKSSDIPVSKKFSYIRFAYTHKGKREHISMHRAVYFSFSKKDPNDNKEFVVDHIDENKHNNRLSNLQLITRSSNTIKSIDKMTNKAWEDYMKNLGKSSNAVWRVAMYIHSLKHKVTIPPLHIADSKNQYMDFVDEGDLILHRDGKEEIIEVKHQSWDWATHDDIPWKSLIVCAKKSYDRHEVKPSAYFLVNTQLTHALVIPTSMYEHWWTEDVHDKKKDWVQRMYKTDPKKYKFIKL